MAERKKLGPPTRQERPANGSAGQGQGDRTPEKSRRPQPSYVKKRGVCREPEIPDSSSSLHMTCHSGTSPKMDAFKPSGNHQSVTEKPVFEAHNKLFSVAQKMAATFSWGLSQTATRAAAGAAFCYARCNLRRAAGAVRFVEAVGILAGQATSRFSCGGGMIRKPVATRGRLCRILERSS